MTALVPGDGTEARPSILDIIQRAAPKIGMPVPGAIFGDTSAVAVELASIANEVCQRIIRAHDWSRLKLEQQYIGNGAADSYALPVDYLRMPKDGRVWSTADMNPLVAVQSGDDWLRLSIRNLGITRGAWIILNGAMQFYPALVDGDTIRFHYISKYAAFDGVSGGLKSAFTADTDSFLLDDRVLELGIIWEWRNRKGLPYQEDMATAEIALAQAINDDVGAHVLTQRGKTRLLG